MNINILVSRHSQSYIVEMILPVMLTVYVANLVYFLCPKEVEVRLGEAAILIQSHVESSTRSINCRCADPTPAEIYPLASIFIPRIRVLIFML